MGDTDVSLYAQASSAEGGTLDVDFQVSTRGGGPGDTVAEGRLSTASGQDAVFVLRREKLEAAAGDAVTGFDWKVRATDLAGTSDWSAVCHFSFDPTHPGTPVISEPLSTTGGQPVNITVGAPTTGPVPSGYLYQLNGRAPARVSADATGSATVTVTPPAGTNVLSVTSLSAGGNYGGTATVVFITARPASAQADGDLTGDGRPDLLTVGGRDGLPSGLWLAAGDGAGGVSGSPSDIGVRGYAIGGSSSDFDGSTVITGHFTGGAQQDVLVYFPTGPRAGMGVVVQGNGDGSPLDPVSGNTFNIMGGSLQDVYGDNPVQLANAGNVSGRGTGLPDLIGISGDSVNGYALNLYASGFMSALYFPVALTADTPDGTKDWDDWTIATTQLPATGGGSRTAMFLWNRSTGELDLWDGLAADPETGELTYTARPVATGWNTGAALSLRAADANADGTPDLWTVSTDGTVTTNLFTDLSGTAPATLTRVTGTLTTG
ncbi:hypothetical protein AB0G87_16065 [Streptomyces asoensis]|uniref:hypothetical protein n=1 Tax=Streptomyces asoensis TaxID=249586 RepID=UPI0033CB8824